MNSVIKSQILVFLLSFLCNLSRHALMEGWVMAKSDVHNRLGFSTTWIGAIDMSFLFMYACGNFVLGVFGDAYNLVMVVSLGLILSSCLYSIIVILSVFSAAEPGLFMIIFGIIGFLQAATYPGTVAIMGKWFSKDIRGKVIGFWSSCSALGNVVGSQLSALIKILGYQWELTVSILLINAIVVASLFWMFVKDTKNDSSLLEKKSRIPVMEALKLPRVLPYACTFSCQKMLNYGMVMWLPFFLKIKLNLDEGLVGALAGIYDVGGVLGSISLGWMSDKVSDRLFIAVLTLIIPIPFLSIFRGVGAEDYWVFFILVPILGFTLGGGTAFISAVIAADLSQSASNKKTESKSTIAGIIDGSGGLGASFGQLIVRFI